MLKIKKNKHEILSHGPSGSTVGFSLLRWPLSAFVAGTLPPLNQSVSFPPLQSPLESFSPPIFFVFAPMELMMHGNIVNEDFEQVKCLSKQTGYELS